MDSVMDTLVFSQMFLGKAIDPPKVQAIEKALNTLDELGATDFDGRLTALGRQMVCSSS